MMNAPNAGRGITGVRHAHHRRSAAQTPVTTTAASVLRRWRRRMPQLCGEILMRRNYRSYISTNVVLIYPDSRPDDSHRYVPPPASRESSSQRSTRSFQYVKNSHAWGDATSQRERARDGENQCNRAIDDGTMHLVVAWLTVEV
jgi:hypothetical protein